MEINDKFKPENDKEIWFRDTYIIWTMANFNAFMNFCGTEFNLDNAKDCKEWLARDWGVQTKDELIELARNLSDFINESANLLEGMKERDIDNYNETLDFVAWDLCRGTQVLGMGFVAEIIDRETMVDESAKIAYFMQKFYTSWEHLMTHYLNGYEAWANETFDSTQAMVNIQMRKAMYEGIKMNPMVFQVDWNLPIYELPEFTIIENVLLGNDDGERTKSCILQEYNGDATHVIVPDGVIEIRKEAFANKDFIQEVTLPDTVEIIGSCAFADCTALTKINLPESVVKIGEACFWGCTSLENITLPNNLQELDTSALGGNGLVSCTIPESITHLWTTFYKCHKLKEVILPETLKRIDESSFQYCEALTEITIPEGVEYIGVQAFADCPNLEKLNCDNPQFKFTPNTFENSPLENMFAHINGDEEDPLFGFDINEDGVLTQFNDYKAEEVVIPDEVKVIYDEAFAGKNKIKKVVLHDEVVGIGASAFEGCTSLEEINIPDDVFFIGENAFVETPWYNKLSDEFTLVGQNLLIKYSGKNEYVILPNNVNAIIAPAFSHSNPSFDVDATDDEKKDLASDMQKQILGVSIPETVQKIGSYAFAGCINLKEIVIPNSVKILSNNAFANCLSLENAILPQELEVLEQHTFSGCTALKEVTLPTKIDDIEHLVFKDTPFWQTLTEEFTMIGENLLKYHGSGQAIIPDNVVKIAGTAFADNDELTSVVIPNSVEKIGVSAFINCKNLEQVKFGDSIVEICKSAFVSTGLKSISLPNSLEVITKLAFAFCRELEEVEISNSIKLIERQAFAYCEKLVEITIPETLTAIEGGAFADCKSLEKLNVLNPDIIILPGAFDGTKITKEQQDEFCENYDNYLNNVGTDQDDDNILSIQVLTRLGGDLGNIVDLVITVLGEVIENIVQDGQKIIFELQDKTTFNLEFPSFLNEPDVFDAYLNNLIVQFSNVETDKTEVQSGVLAFLSAVNVVFTLSFEELNIKERFEYLLGSIFEVTHQLNGLMLMPNGHLVNHDGERVFTLEGESQLDVFSPKFSAEAVGFKQDEPTMEDDMRYMTSREYLKAQGIPVMEKPMAFALRKSSVKLRNVEGICQRIVALFTTAIYAECLYTKEENTPELIEKLTNKFNSNQYYTPIEEEFMNADEVDEKTIIDFSYNYECVGILLWSLGLFSTQNEPDKIYQVSDISKKMKKFDSLEDMISSAELFPEDLLLQEQDMYLRYHWACVEANLKGEAPANNMDMGAVVKRHKALNWVLTDIFGDDWDDTQTPA